LGEIDKKTVATFIAREILYSDDTTQLEKQMGAYLLCYVLNARITNSKEQSKWMQLAVEYSKERENKNGDV
jgi:hypothetical protein